MNQDVVFILFATFINVGVFSLGVMLGKVNPTFGADISLGFIAFYHIAVTIVFGLLHMFQRSHDNMAHPTSMLGPYISSPVPWDTLVESSLEPPCLEEVSGATTAQ